jgi:hypothetical protein
VTTDKEEVKKRLKEIEQKSKKKDKLTSEELGKLVSTRAKLERDYKEDVIEVEFKTSPQTTRMLKVRRPNTDEYLELLELILQAAKFEKSMNIEDIEGFKNVVKKLGSIAANITIDDSLDEKFWRTKVSSPALQAFINSVMAVSNTGFSNVSEGELKSFRGK